MRNDTVETLIGAVVIAVAVVFLFFAYRAGTLNAEGYELNARVSRVDGIAVGTDVRLSGNQDRHGLGADARSQLSRHGAYEHPQRHTDPRQLLAGGDASGLLGSSYLSISRAAATRCWRRAGRSATRKARSI